MKVENKLIKIANVLLKRLANQLITPDKASYQEPNPDNSKKQCANCAFWIKNETCGLFDPHVRVLKNQVCNYYCFGTPNGEILQGKLTPINPITAGLITPVDPAGTSCSNCPAYQKDSTCKTVKDPETKQNAKVEARGCCNFWGGDLMTTESAVDTTRRET